MPGLFNIQTSINIIYHINKLNEENNMIMSLEPKNAFKNLTPLHNQSLEERRYTRNLSKDNQSNIQQTKSQHQTK